MPKPGAESAAAAAAALRDATQAAKEAVAVAMANLNASASLQQSAANDVDNLTKKVEEVNISTTRTTHGHRGGRGRGPRPAKVEVPDTDFDFESANAKFNKHDVVKEAIAGSPMTEAPNGATATADAAADAPARVEPAYNKAKSFFDNISSEMKDRENKLSGREWRGEEQRKNIETFGQGSVDGGYRNYRGGRGRGRGGRGRGYRGGRGGHGGFRQPQTQPVPQ